MYRRPYVESSVFIAYIKGEMRGRDHDCFKIFDSILESAKDGSFNIFTSSLTIAEVFKNKRQGVQLTDQENLDLRPYFREGFIRLIEVDRDIAERANELCRLHQAVEGKPALRPNDAIHLASAERANCEVLLAYDPDLTKQEHDSIRIEWPQTTALVIVSHALELGDGVAPFQERLALTDSEGEDSSQQYTPNGALKLAAADQVGLADAAGDETEPPDTTKGNTANGKLQQEEKSLRDGELTAKTSDATEQEPKQIEKEPEGFKAPGSFHAVIEDVENPFTQQQSARLLSEVDGK